MSSPKDLLQVARVPKRLIFSRIVGSQSYNTALAESSDVDYQGVFVRDTWDILGIFPPRETTASKEAEKPDYTVHEAGKFAKLLVKGNPTMIEMLFGDSQFLWVDPDFQMEWDALQEHRHIFLNQQTLRQYMGYAHGQWERLRRGRSLHTTGGTFNPKWAYHVIRLLMNARQVARREAPTVYWPTGSEEHSMLMRIRTEDVGRNRIGLWMNKIIAEIEATPKGPLPPAASIEWVNSWLFEIRRRQM